MTDRNLNIRVSLSAANKLSGPVSAASRAAAGLASQIKSTAGDIKSLASQAKTFDRLSDSIKKNSEAYGKAKAKAKELAAQFPKFREQTEEQRKILAAARQERDRYGRTLDKEKQKLQAVGAQMYRHGVSVRQSDNATAQITRRTEIYNQQLAEQQRRLNAVTRAQNNYSKAKEMRRKLATAGAAATAGSAGILYAASRMIKPGRDFDVGMSGVQALTRLDKNDPRLAMLEKQARELGASTAFTAADAAAGQKFLAMANLTPESIKAALPGVLNMALADDMDLGEAADIGSNVLTQFKLNADQMDRVSDVLTATFTRSNTDLRQLGETMTYAGPIAADLGVSLESMASMAAMMAANGMRGSMAGTALRGGLSRLVAPVGAGADAMKALGIKVSGANGSLRDMGDILKELEQKLRKYDRASQIRIKKDIFGEEAMVGMGAVLEGAANGKYDEQKKANENSKGEAGKVAKVKTDNLDGDIKSLSSAWQDLGIQIKKSVDPALRSLTQQLTEVARKVGDWMKANPGLTSALTMSVLVIGTLIGALGALALAAAAVIVPLAAMKLSLFMLTGGGGIGKLIPSVGRLTGGLKGLLPSLGGVSRSVKGWGPIFKNSGAALSRFGSQLATSGANGFKALSGGASAAGRGIAMAFGALRSGGTIAIRALMSGFSLLLSPLGLLIAAVVGAAILIWKYWEPIKAFFSGFLDGLIKGLAPIKEAFNAVFTPLAPIFDGIASAVKKVWDWFTKLFEPVNTTSENLKACTEAGKTFGEIVGTAISALMLPITAVARGLGWILEKLGAIPDATKAAAEAANAMNDKPVKVSDSTSKKLDEVGEKVKQLVVPTWASGILPALGDKTKGIINKVKAAASAAEKNNKLKQDTAVGDNNTPAYGTQVYIPKGDKKNNKNPSGGGANTSLPGTTASLADANKLGDIVFKNHPAVTAIDGMYREPQLNVPRASLLSRLKDSAMGLASAVLPEPQPAFAGIPVPIDLNGNRNSERQRTSDNYTFELNFYGVDMRDSKALADLVKEKIRELMRENNTRRRSRLTDGD
ncbi:phage tail tape measure protein [Photorhabdus laumondii subsp. laumondii]|uniref:Phage tail tape measure protein n=1 Tax=Photorhabdus laumondii subsp. laumondii TaxID=141679 RepID=A0A6L9JQT3_PHOLM|nr:MULTISPECIES: phage tail tape measure protein [Photorhabdus]AXG42679.1 phage tail tape measure protein [Photorhabdus laumondii subsp. laumondii]MCC8384209.1 phage tail tape measure protein [Photorhabdus laumondii]MCC8414754.1 phage tail tape measure protein [Photorhabdus laumondii]NDK94317.1 phage tail tape measure protein [Photorhabdus laumondii subsp. laumondii]NDL14982.1 phage tail tape measure protein [Photorhabdus laumondii subsp. laumondii]